MKRLSFLLVALSVLTFMIGLSLIIQAASPDAVHLITPKSVGPVRLG